MLTCYLLGRNVVHAIAWNGSYLEWTLDSIFTTKKKKGGAGGCYLPYWLIFVVRIVTGRIQSSAFRAWTLELIRPRTYFN